jgi:hypothetical protein
MILSHSQAVFQMLATAKTAWQSASTCYRLADTIATSAYLAGFSHTV